MPVFGLRALQALGVVWALPVSALGLLLAAAAVSMGATARISRKDFALVVQKFPWGPGGAITFGNVILHTGADLDCACTTYAHRAGLCQDAPIILADHERAHVYQYMVLGVLFLPLYLLCGGVSYRNRFEQAADRYAQTGRGWWPWAIF